MSRTREGFFLLCMASIVGGCMLDQAGGGGLLLDASSSGPFGDAAAPTPGDAAGATMDAAPSADASVEAGFPRDDAGPEAGPWADGGSDAEVEADAGWDAGCVDDALGGSLVTVARPAVGLTLDGDLRDWTGRRGVSISAPGAWVGSGSPSETDISARLAAAWTSDALWLAIRVTDDEHTNERSGSSIWRGDCVQVAFDVGENGGSGYDDTDDFEYGYALSQYVVQRYRWVDPSGSTAPMDDARIVRAAVTRYEIRLTPSDLGLTEFSRGMTVGFSWMVNEDDGSGDRQGFIEWSSGIGMGKNPGLFGTLHFAGPACP